MSDVSFNPKTNWQLNETVNPEDANRWEQGIKDCTDAIDDLNDFAEHTLGKVIGEVYPSYSASAADNPGALPLFTGEVIASANTLYPDFYNWLAAHPELQISEADYETAISTYGECPKYVLNTSAHTIRLAKLTSYIKMANTTDGITQAADSIPLVDHIHVFGDNSGNNGGKFVASNQRVTAPNPDITEGSGYRSWNGSGGGGSYGGDTDTSTGNMITSIGIEAPAKNATEQGSLQPAHTTLFPWVIAYNTVVPASTAQAAEFQQVLSEKVDKADLEEVHCVIETYTNGSSWYRLYDDGWCEQGGVTTGPSAEDITLLKPYRDTNGTVLVTPATINAPSSTAGNPIGGFVNASTIRVSSSNGYSPAYWQASGYIE